ELRSEPRSSSTREGSPMIRRVLIIAGLLAIGFAPGAKAATKSGSGFSSPTIGPRLGFGVDPDQVVLGGHLSTAFATDWSLNPSIEVGVGDGETVTSFNFDAEYHFAIQGSTWSPYAGLGMGIHFVHVDASAPNPDLNDTASGLNIILGSYIPSASGQKMFTELRLGAGDSSIPQVRAIFGWNFRL